MSKTTYAPVSQEEPVIEDTRTLRPSPKLAHLVLFGAVLVVALVSVIANCIHLYRIAYQPWDLSYGLPSRYARLSRNVPLQFVRHTAHDSIDRTVQDAAWNEPDLQTSSGFIAIKDDYATALSLPHSQRWPWDSSKGVYVLQSFHELDCLHMFREAYNQYYDGVKDQDQTWPYRHVMHCLNVLRQSVMCNADDTPLYIGRLHANINSTEPRAGIGFARMCRNWQLLNAWSRSHSACYELWHNEDDSKPGFDSYKNCPDGSRPWEKIEGDEH